jgi:hypothetical protein
MSKRFNIHDWQAKQRLVEQDDYQKRQDALTPGKNPDAFYGPDSVIAKMRSQESMSNADIKALQTVVGNYSLNKVLNTLAVIADRIGKPEEGDMIQKLANQIQDFDSSIDETNTTGTGVSFNAGPGMGHFGKKKKKVNEQENSFTTKPVAPTTDSEDDEIKADSPEGPPEDSPESSPESELSPDVELALKFSSRINTRPEWVELVNKTIDLEIRGISNSIKATTLRDKLKELQ